MFKDAFIKLDRVQAGKMIDLINPKLDIKFDSENSNVMIHNLSFYNGYFLTEIARHDQHPPIVRNAVCNDKGDVFILDWTNAAIHQLNKIVPITLDETTMPDYIRFFFTYVRGSHGRFIVIDTVDDIEWKDEPAPAGRKALAKMIEPLHIKSKDSDGSAIFSVSIIFKESLFQAEAHLTKDGMLSLRNEELLVEDIPVADDLFGQ